VLWDAPDPALLEEQKSPAPQQARRETAGVA
jgi:hypothetical protein